MVNFQKSFASVGMEPFPGGPYSTFENWPLGGTMYHCLIVPDAGWSINVNHQKCVTYGHINGRFDKNETVVS